MIRRDFIRLSSALAAAALAPVRTPAGQPGAGQTEHAQRPVDFIVDGIYLPPLEYAQILSNAATAEEIVPDHYSNGGVIEQLEHKLAQWLGKERAVFMPTGTLANHLAVRSLAGKARRVIVQAESHLYNDSGDCAQTLSGLNLVPLAPGRAAFTVDEVRETLRRTRSGRVSTRVGVISIESPVRRRHDAAFGYDEMRRVAELARERGIALHLDGARLFVESVHTGISPAQYAELFDTVYISLYKCFNAAGGAILAGSRALIDDMYHLRRAFGGSMAQAWPCAAVAIRFVDGFMHEYAAAWKKAQALFEVLQQHGAFRIEAIPNGTHVVKLHVPGYDPDRFRDRLRRGNIHIPPAQQNRPVFALKINPSLNRARIEHLAQAFTDAV